MAKKIIIRQWVATLLQGIFLVALSVIVFRNPGAVLTAIALWLGMVVMIAGLAGIIVWLTGSKEERETLFLLGNIVLFIAGILMLVKIIITIKAITIVFGLLVIVVGLLLVSAAWNAKEHISLWWLTALLGLTALVMGIKSIADISSGSTQVNNFIGSCILVAGLCLVSHAFLKKILLNKMQNRISGIETELRNELKD